jgi:hypothetical protein
MFVHEQSIAVTLPADSTRLMLVQPFLRLHEPLQEPFPLTEACAAHLTVAIDSVFQKVTAHRPQVVLFPEFAIPGVQGVQQIAAHLASVGVPSPTIVIGGVSGLAPAAFNDLCGLPEVALVDLVNAPGRVNGAEWVNTSVTFVKDDGGTVRLWLQPKLSPSWPETQCHHQAMFKGDMVRIFRAASPTGYRCGSCLFCVLTGLARRTESKSPMRFSSSTMRFVALRMRRETSSGCSCCSTIAHRITRRFWPQLSAS